MLTAVLAATLLLPISALGQPGSAEVAMKWDSDLREIDALLVAGKAKKAHSQTTALVGRMTETMTGGEGASQFLGVAMVLRAIASHHLGRDQEASWHWQVAVQLFPDLGDYEMTAYGDTGSFLRSQMPRSSANPPGDVFGSARPREG